MARDVSERRFHTERRLGGGLAPDLYRRIEEKRQQIERRRELRRSADREAEFQDERTKAVDEEQPTPARRAPARRPPNRS
jgi:hypothetical protein